MNEGYIFIALAFRPGIIKKYINGFSQNNDRANENQGSANIGKTFVK
jgi:hypothetical protein